MLVVSACGGSDSADAGATGGSADESENADPDADAGADGADSDGADASVEPSVLEGVDGALPDLTGPVDPVAITNLVGALTQVPPEPDELTCLLDNTDGDSQLTEVLNGFGIPGYVLEPEGFTALAVNTHECVDEGTLVDSLAGLSTFEDDDSAEFRTCIAGHVGDETNGDLAYTGLSALLVGFDIPEGASQMTFDAVTECVSSDDLAEQVSFQSEAQQGFAVMVDRECVADGLDNEAILAFWGAFILQEGDSSGIMALLEGCTSEFSSGLAQELPEDFAPWAGQGALAAIDPAVRNGVYSTPPPNVLEDGVDYQAVLTTSDGEFTIDLFEDTAPITVNNFVALARDGFYDATTFHRVLPGFMAQAGDPTGTGSGGPGYSFDDEESALTEIDRRGLLAMANAGPNTNGGQFFITFEPVDRLTGLHAVFGELIEGDAVLAEVDLRDPQEPTSRGEQLISVVITEN